MSHGLTVNDGMMYVGETVGVLLSLAEEQADHAPEGKSRPVLPAGFRRKVGALVIEVDRRKRSILAEDVT